MLPDERTGKVYDGRSQGADFVLRGHLRVSRDNFWSSQLSGTGEHVVGGARDAAKPS